MLNSKETIISILADSPLTQEQKNLWHNFLENLDAESASHIAKTIQEDENALNILTENIEDKIKALSSADPDDFEIVVQKEKNILKNITE